MNKIRADGLLTETLKLARSLGQVHTIKFHVPMNLGSSFNEKKKKINKNSFCKEIEPNESISKGSRLKRPLEEQGNTSNCKNQRLNDYCTPSRRKLNVKKIATEQTSTKLQSQLLIRNPVYIKRDEKKIKSELSYIIVMDFESTCWKDMSFFKSAAEIIEFPAVLMNLTNGQIEDQFQQFVMPVEQPKLSNFCTELTGITQAQVDCGVPLGHALWKFSKWLETITLEKNLVSIGSSNVGAKFAIITWSDWDLNVCLRQECQRKGIQMPKSLRQWVDLRAIYREWYGRPPRGVKGSMEDVGLIFIGQEHSGLTDSQNTARLALQMVWEGAQLTLSTASVI